MRSVVLIIAALMLSCGCRTVAIADEPDPFQLVAEARPFREHWQECTASAVEAGLRSAGSAKAVVDAALKRCRADERALARALSRRMGPDSSRRIVTELREYDRLVLTRIVERLRAR